MWVAMVFVLWGCGSQDSEVSIVKPVEIKKKEVKIDERIRRLVASDFPTLTDDNASDFLQEWGNTQSENRIALDTKYGRIVVELFDDVPIHRANFLYKVYRR